MPQASTWSASSSTPQRDEHWTSLFLFLALTIVFLVMLKQGKRRFEEDSFEDHKDNRWKFIEGGEYKCLFPGCGKASNQVSQSTAWKQRNRTFQSHIKTHNWNVPRLPVSTSERGFEGDAAEQHQNGDKFVRFEQTPAIEVEKRIESLRFITNEEKHLLQLAWVKKKYQTFSNKAFDALFHRVDWAIALPPQEISWRKTDNVIAKYLPVWDSETILCGSQEIPYVSVSTITNKIVTLKNHKLGGWPAPRSDSLLTDVYDGMYWRTLLQEGFFTWGDKEEKRNLVFALYCDGFAKFRTKGHSTTGVYLIPLNLPIHERMKKKNWFTVAVVPKTLKKKEPTEEELLENYRENLMVILERLAKDFNSLESGTWIPNPINATIRVRLGLVVADLPALAEILCKVFPTGTRACHVCLQDFREWLEFSEDSTKLRSHQGTLTQASVVELAKKQALDTTLLEQSHGISGKTPLFEMANFDFTRNVAIDAMHNLPMGICKASITDSIEGTLASESRDNLAKVERAESVLKSARHTDMDRNRSLKNLKSYTAYEWLFLVRFGLPIFAALGADDHLEHLGDLFYVALNWLSSKIPAESLSSLSEAYGKTMRSRRDRFGWTKGDLNSHLPVHYEQLIKMWGPLIAFWCWAMERQNQSLKKIIDGGNNKNVEQYVMKELLVTSDLIEFIEPTLLPKTTGQSKAHPHRPTEKVVDFQEPQRCLWLLPEVWDSTLRLAPGDVFGLDGHGPRQFFYLECITLNASEEVELWTAPLRLLPPPNFGRMSPYFLNLESETSLPLSTINVAVYKRFLLSTLKPKLFPFFVVQERDERLYKFLKVVVSLVPERFPLLHQLKIDLVDGE